ncbi:Histone deacetylase associated PHD protein-2 [Mycena kentingensis (nom. inval.)]|nr:Histone deacetylase associated PHD protein-2 [Mycena kentingensis (nom. inval.)]
MATVAAYLLPGVPVQQPLLVEGDSSLATEILPGPPPLIDVLRPEKRDPKKPFYSYLYPTDPGSTYSGIMHGTIIAQDDAMNGKRSAVSGRAQRASARNHNGTAGELPGPSVSEPYNMVLDDEAFPSRSTSVALQDGDATYKGRNRAKGKGKAKETDGGVRIKEEPRIVSLQATPDPQINNDDHCSSCRSHGALVYCDGCPRAFHLWCLNPPLEHIDDGDSRWFCPACVIRKHPPRKPPPGLFSPLIAQVQASIPTEYQLPDEIRTFFRDVGTGPKGSYVDNSVVRQPRVNRFGLIEDRDSQRLRDKNGDPVLCFKCGTSTLPAALVAPPAPSSRPRRATAKAASDEIWKSMVSCDYCNLHWHLDCLDPPLTTMPPINKKWMCPNHAEKIKLPKLRIPKSAAAVEITKPKQFNNGNIEIIHTQASTTRPKKVAVDEVYINGRKYRVPERIVILDFWNKVSNKTTAKDGSESGSELSSPLTSLSSLEDAEMFPAGNVKDGDDDNIRAAQMLWSFQRSVRNSEENAVETESPSSILKRNASAPANGDSHPSATSADDAPSTSTAKRKRTSNGNQLRPDAENVDSTMVSVSSRDSSSLEDVIASSSRPNLHVKVEDHEPHMPKRSAKSTGRQIRPPAETTTRRGEDSGDFEPLGEQTKKSRTEKGLKGQEARKTQSPKKVLSSTNAAAGSSTQITPTLKIRLPPLSAAARTSTAD